MAVLKTGTRTGIIALTLAMLSASAVSARGGSFEGLNGSWSGQGQIRLENGKSENLKCRAYYVPKDGDAALGLAIRCASPSNKVELRANLIAKGHNLSGTWEERVFNASGDVTGEINGNKVEISIAGGGFSGTMNVTTSGASQQVSINTQGIALKGVNIGLRRD
jgi:hypothetical protein